MNENSKAELNNETNAPSVPYIAYESELFRMERIIKGLTIALAFATGSLLVSNLIKIKR